jgi:hypothetical protein
LKMFGSALIFSFRALLISSLLLVLCPVSEAGDKPGRRVVFINETPGFYLDITMDGKAVSTLCPGKREGVPVQDEKAAGRHELLVKAFVQSKYTGRRQIGRMYTKTFTLSGQAGWSPAGKAHWYHVFAYRDFLPQLAAVTPERHGARGAGSQGVSYRLYLDEGAGPAWSKGEIEGLVCEASEKYSLPVCLLTAVISVESAFDPKAVSCKGALGLMQLMPQTCKRFKVRRPLDPQENIEGGAKYLSYLLHRWSLRFPESRRLELSLAAYHAGEGTVEQYGGVPPYKETRKYVREVLKRSRTL